MHVIAAKAVCFKEALSDEFKTYTKMLLEMQKFYQIDCLKKVLKFFRRYRYTSNALDLDHSKSQVKDAQASLGRANITCNKNGILLIQKAHL